MQSCDRPGDSVIPIIGPIAENRKVICTAEYIQEEIIIKFLTVNHVFPLAFWKPDHLCWVLQKNMHIFLHTQFL